MNQHLLTIRARLTTHKHQTRYLSLRVCSCEPCLLPSSSCGNFESPTALVHFSLNPENTPQQKCESERVISLSSAHHSTETHHTQKCDVRVNLKKGIVDTNRIGFDSESVVNWSLKPDGRCRPDLGYKGVVFVKAKTHKKTRALNAFERIFPRFLCVFFPLFDSIFL